MIRTWIAAISAGAAAVVINGAGCQTHPAPPPLAPVTQPATRPLDRLGGVWIADHPDPSSGDLQIKLVLQKRRHQRLLEWSELPMRGEAVIREAPYSATDSTIQSDALPHPPAQYRFDDAGQLLLQQAGGAVVVFHRVR